MLQAALEGIVTMATYLFTDKAISKRRATAAARKSGGQTPCPVSTAAATLIPPRSPMHGCDRTDRDLVTTPSSDPATPHRHRRPTPVTPSCRVHRRRSPSFFRLGSDRTH